ncbi:MAG: DUF481 domain-containing protein [Verrucomicrobia bacterium]|nr:DUF481 domain-containing protein [Verrucomicrobiota bacterium]
MIRNRRAPETARIVFARLAAWVLSAAWMLVLAQAAEPVVLLLKNGDRWTGEILSTNGSRVVIRSPIAGRVTVKRDQIESISKPGALPAAAGVSTNGPPVAAAASPPKPAPAPPAPAPAPPAAVPQVAAAAATNAVPVEPLLPGWFTGVWTNWHGNLQAGLNLGVGTTDRVTMYVNGTATKKRGRTLSSLTYNAAYGEANDVPNANQMAGTGRLEYEISPNRRTYAYVHGAAGYDVIRKIDIEYLGGGGFGYKILDQPKRVLAMELGTQYQEFNYATGTQLGSVAVRLGQNFTTTIDKLSITQRLGFTPSVEDLSNYQVNLWLTFSYPLFKSVTINLNLIDQYLSQPAAGVQNNDLQIQTTLGVTF